MNLSLFDFVFLSGLDHDCEVIRNEWKSPGLDFLGLLMGLNAIKWREVATVYKKDVAADKDRPEHCRYVRCLRFQLTQILGELVTLLFVAFPHPYGLLSGIALVA